MSSILPKALSVGIAAASFALSCSNATLTIDLRATTVNGVPAANPKSVEVFPGQTVSFDVYAIVTGATEAAGLEGFQIAIGSITSGAGGSPLGDILTNEIVAPFNGAGSTIGTRVDLDADTDVDLGSNNAALDSNFIGVRSAAMTLGNANGLGASEFKFYTFTFQVRAGQNGGSAAVNWRKTDLTGLTTEYIWQENGVLTNSRGVNGGSVPLILNGPSVSVLVVPEPTAFGMVLMGAMGVVGFRRLGFKRS